MLTPFGDDIWTLARPLRFFGVETGARMAVVRLAGGGLFVHSPLALDDELRREVDALGTVVGVVAPSVFHHLHVGAWMAAYPKAVFAACPGLDRKRPDLSFSMVLGDDPHPVWEKDLHQVYFSARRENEVVFYLPRRKALISADVLINLSTHPSPTTRFLAKMIGNSAPGVGYLERVMVRDRKVARREVDRILEWDFDRTVLSHGAMLETGGHTALKHAYEWLDR